jgi:hypothetical protein
MPRTTRTDDETIPQSTQVSEVERSIDPPRNFTLTTEERVRAMTVGAPAWAVRKRRIEDALSRYAITLREVGEASQLAGGDVKRIADKVRAKAARLDLAKTNKLIATHNKYYPMEANLPMDMQTGAYMLMGRPWSSEPLVTVDRLVVETLEALGCAPSEK